MHLIYPLPYFLFQWKPVSLFFFLQSLGDSCYKLIEFWPQKTLLSPFLDVLVNYHLPIVFQLPKFFSAAFSFPILLLPLDLWRKKKNIFCTYNGILGWRKLDLCVFNQPIYKMFLLVSVWTFSGYYDFSSHLFFF